MAHELTHVANRDVMVMTIASFFATIAAYIVQFGFFFGGGGATTTTTRASGALILVSLVVYAVSFFLLQALSRYREFAADRGAAIITGRPSALASALHEDLERHGADPQQDLRAPPSCAPSTSSRRRGQGARQPLLDAPAAREAARGAGAARGQLQGTRRLAAWASSTSSRASASSRQPAPDRLFAMATAVRHARDGARAQDARARRRSSSSRSRPPTSPAIVRDMEEVIRGTGEDTGTQVETTDDSFGYRWMVLRDADFEDLVIGINVVSAGAAGRRLRRPRPLRGVPLPRRDRQARLLDLQLQARRVLPVRARRRRAAARQRARAAPQGADRRRAPGGARARALVPLWGIPI